MKIGCIISELSIGANYSPCVLGFYFFPWLANGDAVTVLLGVLCFWMADVNVRNQEETPSGQDSQGCYVVAD